MSLYENRKTASISKWQALLHHEGSVWDTDYASVKTTSINGLPCDDLIIKKKVAAYISEIKRQEIQYTSRRAQITERRATRSALRPQVSPNQNYNDFFKEIGLDSLEFDFSPSQTSEPVEGNDLVAPQDIDLIELTDRSRIHVTIYPLTFRCSKCGHFQIVSEDESDLTCPDCKQNKEGRDGEARRMIQESLIFVCPHCANIDEVTPSRTSIKDARNGIFECPKGCGGHLHFYRGRKLSGAFWRCPKCNYTDRPVRKNCGCSIYSDDSADESQVWSMRLNATAASNTYCLQKTFVEVDKQNITLPILRAKRQKDMQEGKRAWELGDLLQRMDGFTRGIFQQTYDITDTFLVNDVESSTVVYGYTTKVTANRPIQDYERLSKCFPMRGGRYRAYLIKSIGRGLVLVFNKDKIAEIAQYDISPANRLPYDAMIDNELMMLERGVFQENLDQPQRFPMVTAMHAIEHALFNTASNEAGLEIFGSKVLFRDAAVILFERQDVGEGGVIQLTAGEQFLRVANGVYSALSSCGQACEEGCLLCTYITDFYCSPFLETECQRWYPGNSFLNRKLAGMIIGPKR